MPFGTEAGLGLDHIVLDGNPAPPKRGIAAPNCRPISIEPNGWMDQDETGHGGRPRPWPHCVRWADPAPPLPKGHSAPPQFSAHVCCGQRAGWIKMPLGREVGLGASALATLCWMGTQLPFPKGPSPVFGPSILWPNGRPS